MIGLHHITGINRYLGDHGKLRLNKGITLAWLRRRSSISDRPELEHNVLLLGSTIRVPGWQATELMTPSPEDESMAMLRPIEIPLDRGYTTA
jgi:hypothetical protein